MDWNWRKHGVILGIVIIILLSPIFLISSNMMDIYQERIDENPKTDFHRWLQMKSADICAKTLRPGMAAERYRKFMEHYPDDPRRAYALFQFANALEDDEKTADALAIYAQYIEEYPDGPDVQAAHGGIDRLRYMKPR